MGVEAGWEREGVGGVVENTAFDSAARRLENMTDASFSSEPFAVASFVEQRNAKLPLKSFWM